MSIVNYTYDGWGKLLSVTNASGTAITDSRHIANVNPFRYRGYYYDVEIGFTIVIADTMTLKLVDSLMLMCIHQLNRDLAVTICSRIVWAIL